MKTNQNNFKFITDKYVVTKKNNLVKKFFMKVIILCGGLGSRLAGETKTKPKPMVKIVKIPIIVRIIKHYEKYGFKEFIIAAGYKSKIIKDYFKNNLLS